MNPILGGLISGGASLLGSMFSNDTSAQNTQAQIQAQQQMQQSTQAWNEKMSNTAYQRANQDMQAAGLNPAMMFSSGSAASSPQMSPQQVPVAQNRGAGAGIGDAVEKVVSSAIGVKTLDKMTEEIASLRNQQALTAASTATEKERPAQVRAQTSTERQRNLTEVQETQRRSQENSVLGLRMPGLRVSAREAEAIEKMPDWLRDSLSIGSYSGGKSAETLRPIGEILHSAGRAKSLFSDRFHY